MLQFTKMHGLGNDFVVIDGVDQNVRLNPERVRQSAISFGGELGFRLWGNPAQPQDVFAHSVFWFLAPWVTLVQRIGSRHSGLGATIKCRATGI
ncbi:hypothetical protein [Marinobacter salarius]